MRRLPIVEEMMLSKEDVKTALESVSTKSIKKRIARLKNSHHSIYSNLELIQQNISANDGNIHVPFAFKDAIGRYKKMLKTIEQRILIHEQMLKNPENIQVEFLSMTNRTWEVEIYPYVDDEI